MHATSPLSEHERMLSSLEPSLKTLARRGTLRSYRKHSIIVTEGEHGESLYVLIDGEVKVFSTDEHGRELTYSTIGAGDYFGEMSLDGGPRAASVMALQPCVCSVVPRIAVREHLREQPDFAFQLVTQVIRRARTATETARQMAMLDVYGRVVNLLEGQYGVPAPEAPIELTQITHQSIASRVGASREMVSRLLKDLEKGGYVELGVKRITLRKKLPARW